MSQGFLQNSGNNTEALTSNGTLTLATTQTNIYKDPQIEFLVSLLPSYAFVALAIWRFYSIRHFGHSPVQPDLYPLKVIKYIAYGMISIYAFNWIVSYIDHEAVNLSLSDIDLAILYVFPIFAWYLSYELTNAELQRKIEHDPINQFLFWILSIVFSAIKYFKEPKMNELVALIDISQIVLSIGITYYFHSNERQILDFLDDNEEKATLDKQLLDTYKAFSIKIDHNDDIMEDMETSRERLPKIDVKIPRKFQRKMLAQGTFDKYFDIKVSINKDAPYKVSHSLVEFINLAKELRIIYTLSKFKVFSVEPPTIDFENLQKLNLSDDINDVTTMIEELEHFLHTLCTDPIFMHEIVLDFMEINDPYKSQFTKYINLAQMMNSRFSPRRKGSGKSSFELSEMAQSGRISANRKAIYPLQLEARKINVDDSKGKKDIQYKFEITLARSIGGPLIWVISKPYGAFRLLHQKMKHELGVEIPILEDFVPRPMSMMGEEDSYVYSRRMLEGLERYLKTIFSIKKLYCTSLFEFLGVNQGTLELENNSASDSDDSISKRDRRR